MKLRTVARARAHSGTCTPSCRATRTNGPPTPASSTRSCASSSRRPSRRVKRASDRRMAQLDREVEEAFHTAKTKRP